MTPIVEDTTVATGETSITAAPAVAASTWMVAWTQADSGEKLWKDSPEAEEAAKALARKMSKDHGNAMMIERRPDTGGKAKIYARVQYTDGKVNKEKTAELNNIKTIKEAKQDADNKSAKLKEQRKASIAKSKAASAKEAGKVAKVAKPDKAAAKVAKSDKAAAKAAPKTAKKEETELTGDDAICKEFHCNSVAPRGRVLRRLLKSIGKSVALEAISKAAYDCDTDECNAMATAAINKLNDRIKTFDLPYMITREVAEKSGNVSFKLEAA